MDLRVRSWVLWAMCAALLAGCSGKSGPATAPVSGTVKLKGNPIEGAQVSFFIPEKSSRAAIAKTDAQGRYQLSAKDGAVIGMNTVTVSKAEVVAGAENVSAAKPDAMYGQMMAKAAKGVPMTTGKEIPVKYANPLTSRLQYEVKKGNNTYDINLD